MEIVHILIPNINHRCLLLRKTYIVERLLRMSNHYQDGDFLVLDFVELTLDSKVNYLFHC